MLEREEVREKVKRAVREMLESEELSLQDSSKFVEDLGFDSLRMASLSLALEQQFDQALLLNDWISAAESPRALTIGSLTDYLYETFEDEDED